MSIENFLRASQSAGTLVSEGVFSLGARARLEGIQKAVSAELGNFALKLIQGLVGSGATRIACQIGASEFLFEAAGCRHPDEGLLARFSTDIGDRRDPVDDLAYSVLGALGIGVSEVEWSLSGGEAVVMDKAGSRILASSNEPGLTVFRFKFRGLYWPPKTVRVRTSVHHLLATRCCYCPIPLTVDSRPLEPAELCGWYRSESSLLGHQEVILNGKPVANPITAQHRYRYWGRLDIFELGKPPVFQPPPLDELGVQILGDGSKANLSLQHHTSFLCFFLAKPVLPRSPSLTEAPVIDATVYLLADPNTAGDRCLPVHRGVTLSPTSQGPGHSRALVLCDAEGLALDASTLAVAENDQFQQRRVRLTRYTLALLEQVVSLRSLAPEGAAKSFDQLDP